MTKFSFCNNCGKQGHLYHHCKRPITSLGIVAFRRRENELEFLMICRKNSLGFVDFMRGKYKLQNILHLNNLINEMTNQEKINLLNNNFNLLWKDLWGDYVGMQYRGEETSSRDKFAAIGRGIKLRNGSTYNLKQLVENNKTEWVTPEWEFPKGRRNYQENDLTCALREFEEETGFNKVDVNVIQNIIPFEEIYTGSNFKSYKHKYFIGMIDSNTQPSRNFQQSEVSQIKWMNLADCIASIRPYNLEKIDMISHINKSLEKYRLIS